VAFADVCTLLIAILVISFLLVVQETYYVEYCIICSIKPTIASAYLLMLLQTLAFPFVCYYYIKLKYLNNLNFVT